MNDYTAEQLHEYFLQSPPEVQEILLSDDLETTSTVLGKLYKLPIDKFLTLKNIITLILLGIIKPENVVDELQKQISLEKDSTVSLAKDLNDSVLQEARIKLFGTDEGEIKILKVKDVTPTPELLREELMSKTKLESAINKQPGEILITPTKETAVVSPVVASSHSQLLDQLQVIETLPKDDEIEDRLAKIRMQIEIIQNKTKIEEKKEAEEEKKEEELIIAQAPRKPIFPDHYNIDPYREITEVI